jgi:hypothetical protein
MKIKNRKNKTGEINDGHYLELMDRLHVLMCTLDEHCVKHPVSKKNKDIKFKLEYALGQLWDAYQEVGNQSLKKEKNENGIQKVIFRRHKNSKD